MFGVRQKIMAIASRRCHCLRLPRSLRQPLLLADLRLLLLSRNQAYFYCVYFFDHFLPAPLREHRRYFRASGRGFGEDAFHVMWFLLFQELRPRQVLEIGVYRGQTITLWKLLSQHLGFECNVGCVSPFTSSGDSVSQYEERIDYYQDMLQNHRRFELPPPEICRGFSTSPEAKSFVTGRLWDVIYIDGNHDYEMAKSDWALCSQSLAPRGIIVLDDSAFNTDYRPPVFATVGHPGPSRLAQEIDIEKFQEIFSAGHNRVFQRIA